MPNRDDYFLTAADVDNISLIAVPATYVGNSRITPLIGPNDFYTDLRDSLNRLGTNPTPSQNRGQFIFISNWTIGLGDNDSEGGPFSLAGRDRTPLLRDILVEKAQRGVDVRVMGWMSICVFFYRLGRSLADEVVRWNRETLETIRVLRHQSNNQIKACINTLNHARGAVHPKLVIIGDGAIGNNIGYTGGLDFISTRHGWHDVMAKIEGPALHGLYEFYRQMWNETVTEIPSVRFSDGTHSLDSVVSGTSNIIDRTSLSLVPAIGTHSVQSLRTVPTNPRSRNALINCRTCMAGIFEVRAAWRKAIQAATRYIYMEDQYFWSDDVMGWIKQAVINHTELVVILVCCNNRGSDYEAYSNRAIQDHLLDGLNPGQRSRIALFRRNNIFVHSKTTLIDDCWAIIGSANCNNRGLFTDFEHSVSMFHEELVRNYRTQLWSSHFQDNREVIDCDQALHVWNSNWGSSGSGTSLRSEIEPWSLSGEMGLWDRFRYNQIVDPDSRSINDTCVPYIP